MPGKGKMDVDLEAGKTTHTPPVKAGRMVGGRRHGSAHPGHLQGTKDAKSEHNTSNIITPADAPEEDAIVAQYQDPPKNLKKPKNQAYPPPKAVNTRAANKKSAQMKGRLGNSKSALARPQNVSDLAFPPLHPSTLIPN